MAKDKRKKKFLQGMEHLRESVEEKQKAQSIEPLNAEYNKEHRILRKDLVISITIMSILILSLVGLMVLDNSGDFLTNLSGTISSIFIK